MDFTYPDQPRHEEAHRALADDLLKGADEAATYLGLSRRQVYRMADAGELPAIRKGNLLFFRKSQLDSVFAPPPVVNVPRPIHPQPERQEGITYAQIVAIAMAAGDVPSERFSACAANIKYLQRQPGLGYSGTGRGKRAYYEVDYVWTLLFACELQHIGMTAGQITPVLAQHDGAFLRAVKANEPLRIEIAYAARVATLTIDVPMLRAKVAGFPMLFAAEVEQHSDRLARRMGGEFAAPEHVSDCRLWAGEECNCK